MISGQRWGVDAPNALYGQYVTCSGGLLVAMRRPNEPPARYQCWDNARVRTRRAHRDWPAFAANSELPMVTQGVYPHRFQHYRTSPSPGFIVRRDRPHRHRNLVDAGHGLVSFRRFPRYGPCWYARASAKPTPHISREGPSSGSARFSHRMLQLPSQRIWLPGVGRSSRSFERRCSLCLEARLG